jgi:cell division GTPase FtsZ
MKTILVGVGQAGGKLADRLVTFDQERGYGSVQNAIAINSAKADLQPLAIDTVLIGQSQVKGHGVGGDNELGAEIMEADLQEVQQKVGNHITTQAESIILTTGLGGGTGSGGTPVLARRLKEIYEIPVYVLAVLPSTEESNLAQVNAGRSLKTITDTVDATLVIDNDTWKSTGESLTEGYERINKQIAKRIGLLLAAGEGSDGVAESVVDSSEIINTLRTGGIAAIGYNEVEAAESTEENINTVMTATRSALFSGLSLTGETTAESALLVITGKPDRISRKGVEKSRRWLEDETRSMQVRGGDFPTDSEQIGALVVLGGIQHSDRIESFFARAKDAAAAPTETEEDDEKMFQNDEIDGI